MDVLTILATLRRHWYLVGAVLVLTGLAVGAVVLTSEPTYEQRGSYLLTTSDVAASEGVLEDDSGEAAAVDLSGPLVAEAVQSGAVHEQVRDDGGNADYTVGADEQLLRVTAVSSESDEVVPTVIAVLEAIDREVAQIQDDADVPEDRQATVQVIAAPTDASVQTRDLGDEAGTEYVATGSARITGAGGIAGMNPYRESPKFALRILQEVLYSEATRLRIAEAGGTGTYILEHQDDTLPIAHLVVTAPSPQAAAATYDGAADAAAAELDRRQEALGVIGPSQVGLHPLSVQSQPQELPADITRALITLAGIGAAAAVGLALAVDNLQQARQRRRELQLQAHTDADEPEHTHTTTDTRADTADHPTAPPQDPADHDDDTTADHDPPPTNAPTPTPAAPHRHTVSLATPSPWLPAVIDPHATDWRRPLIPSTNES